jgi:DNA-binding MarR family transcriptional regulator
VSTDPSDGAPGEFLDLLYGVLHSLRRETAALLRSVGTTPGQLRFLRTLSRCDSPQRLGEIAERLDVAPRSVTSKVDQAEADGHVRRIPDPTYRRATRIELTDEGRALLAAVAAQQHEGAAERLATLSPDERTELVRLLRQVAGAAAHP